MLVQSPCGFLGNLKDTYQHFKLFYISLTVQQLYVFGTTAQYSQIMQHTRIQPLRQPNIFLCM